ncbi:2-dehydropantoate 2-reductase [Flagelloscypha sp. PMI_526]|nr:2-dehydropantoate 2-reductase [Flagelloscypha sp. PMI_526]
MTTQDNILLFGLGAIGSVYAFVASRAPNTRVYVCARSNLEAISTHGLNIRSKRYGDHFGHKFAAVKTPADMSIRDIKFSYVICANKAVVTTDLPVSEQIAPAVSSDSTIILIQNGVGNDAEFRTRFPGNTVLSGVTWVSANQPTPGTVDHMYDEGETLQLGVHWQDSIPREVQQSSLNHIASLLRSGGTDIEVVDPIDLWRWKKTIWNCVWSCLTALTQCNTVQYLTSSGSAEVVAKRIVQEMNLIARAKGVIIEDEYLEWVVGCERVKKGFYSSMCKNAVYSQPMEVGVIVSKPLSYAREFGIETPTLDVINALICAMDWRFRNGVKPNFAA